MKAPLLSVNRIEFLKIGVEANQGFESEEEAVYQQLMFSFKGVRFWRQAGIKYPESELDDPRSFSFSLRVVLSKENQGDAGVEIPYHIDVQVVAYMSYHSDNHVGFERFRAVRATGYGILYGAIREMVSNLTARGPHGMWMLPAADFNEASSKEARKDYESWMRRKEKKDLELKCSVYNKDQATLGGQCEADEE